MTDYKKRTRHDWTKDEDDALEEAMRIYGPKWRKIEEMYGPTGNGKLADRIHNNKIAGRAKKLAKDRIASNQPLGVFSDVKITDPVQNNDTVSKVNRRDWTPELDNLLIQAYSEHGVKWKDIRDSYTTLSHLYEGTSFRDRLVQLQKTALKSGDIPDPLNKPIPGKEYIYFRSLCPNGKLLTIDCPSCKRTLDEHHLFQTGLSCICGVDIRSLAKATRKFKWLTYIIVSSTSNFPKLPTKPEYIGTTQDFHSRLSQHVGKWLDPSKYRFHISLRLGERTAIRFFQPTRNDEYDRSRDESHFIRINTTNCILDMDLRTSPQSIFDAITDPPITIPRNKDSEVSVPLVGILASPLVDIGSHTHNRAFCFIEGKNTCNCDKPCLMREFFNRCSNLDRWYPLDPSIVKSTAKAQLDSDKNPNLDFTLGNLTSDPFPDFCSQVVIRNQDISQVTKDRYLHNIKVLLNHNFFDSIFNFTRLQHSLESYYSTSYVSALLHVVIVFLKNLSKQEKITLFKSSWFAAYHTFQHHLKLLEQQRQANTVPNKKNEREDANWVPYDELVNLLHATRHDIFSKLKLTSLQPYIALLLHLQQSAIRNDYCSVKLFDFDPHKDNFLDWDNKVFVFNEFKNVASRGTSTQPVKQEVINDLSVLVQFRLDHNCPFLFTDSKNNQMKPSAYSTMLGNFTKKITGGKRIASTLIRKIVVSHFHLDRNSTPEQLQTLASNMMHSSNTAKQHYLKL